jgi:hypothetical protein
LVGTAVGSEARVGDALGSDVVGRLVVGGALTGPAPALGALLGEFVGGNDDTVGGAEQ